MSPFGQKETPRRYQSGEIDYSGRISKRGDGAMRALLYEAASVLTNRIQRFSPLKAWAVRPAARKGFKKATVAAARKIAAPMARRNHLRLDQRGDAGITE